MRKRSGPVKSAWLGQETALSPSLRSGCLGARFALVSASSSNLHEVARVFAASGAETRIGLIGLYDEHSPDSVDELFAAGYLALVPPGMDKTVLFNALHARGSHLRLPDHLSDSMRSDHATVC